MLNDDDGVTPIHQALQDLKQPGNIGGVKASGGLVQDVQRFARRTAGQLRRQLDPLRFPAGKSGGRLPLFDVAQPHILDDLQTADDLRHILEKGRRFRNRHV